MEKRTITDFQDAEGKSVQPYFAAFMFEKGYARAAEPFERDGHNCEYMEWVQSKWSEFERGHGYPVAHFTRNSRSSEFIAWLDRACWASAPIAA